MKRFALAFLLLATAVFAVEPTVIPPGSKIYVDDMNGFGAYMSAAIINKRVPLVIVTNPDMADFELRGSSESQKAGWAKVIITKNANSTEQASVSVVRKSDSAVVFAYSVNKGSAIRGKQSAAESCAKYLRKAVVGK